MTIESSRLRSTEREFLTQLARYLDQQGERFDSEDLGRILRYLEGAPSVLQEDWSRVVRAVETQSVTDPQAGTALHTLREHLQPVEDQVMQFAKSRNRKLGSPLTVFVGAGGSAPAPTSIPTTRSLLPILWNKAEEIGNRPLLRLREQCRSLYIDNIEDLLSAIFLAQGAVGNTRITALLRFLLSGRQEAEDVREEPYLRGGRMPMRPPGQRVQEPGIEIVESLRESLQTLFSVLVGMMVGKEVNFIHQAIARHCQASRNTTVITTNYDVCIETALGEGNYCYGIEDVASAGVVPQDHLTRILKLHGSLNWYACLSCDRYVAATPTAIDTAFKGGLYPVIAMCPTCQATSQQLIIPPIAQKYQIHPYLLDIRQAVEQAWRAAKSIIIVGYSFTEADAYILRMISRAVAFDPDKDIIVLDTESQPGERLKQFLGTHARNYDQRERLIRFLGNASKSLPVLLGVA